MSEKEAGKEEGCHGNRDLAEANHSGPVGPGPGSVESHGAEETLFVKLKLNMEILRGDH